MELSSPIQLQSADLLAQQMMAHIVVMAGWKSVSLVDEPLAWIDSNLDWIFKTFATGLLIHLILIATLGWFGYSYYTAYNSTTIPQLFT